MHADTSPVWRICSNTDNTLNLGLHAAVHRRLFHNDFHGQLYQLPWVHAHPAQLPWQSRPHVAVEDAVLLLCDVFALSGGLLHVICAQVPPQVHL